MFLKVLIIPLCFKLLRSKTNLKFRETFLKTNFSCENNDADNCLILLFEKYFMKGSSNVAFSYCVLNNKILSFLILELWSISFNNEIANS